MRERTYAEEAQYSWIVWSVAVVLVGTLAGYLLTTLSPPASAGPAAMTAPAAAQIGGAPPADESALQAYRDILARDPKNLQAAIGAANMLYDARRYADAIPFYQQAFALAPSDVSISTDLGTALWYSGRPEEALAQYDRSLAIEPAHAQTLFNVGIVRSEGLHDHKGAVEAWQRLLAAHPDYPNATEVRALIDQNK
jgi:tetratricopeptide (TPR) repeat protein